MPNCPLRPFVFGGAARQRFGHGSIIVRTRHGVHLEAAVAPLLGFPSSNTTIPATLLPSPQLEMS